MGIEADHGKFIGIGEAHGVSSFSKYSIVDLKNGADPAPPTQMRPQNARPI